MPSAVEAVRYLPVDPSYFGAPRTRGATVVRAAQGTNMLALIFYVALALGVSFLCSVLEAVLLSITPYYITALAADRPKAGERLRRLKGNVDRPLAAILSLNTIAHTVGAAGAGAQAAYVFGDAYLGVASGMQGTMRSVGQILGMGVVLILFSVYSIGQAEITPEKYPIFLTSVKMAFVIFAIINFVGTLTPLTTIREKLDFKP